MFRHLITMDKKDKKTESDLVPAFAKSESYYDFRTHV